MTASELLRVLEDAHDALGELMSDPFVQIDWGDLAAHTGNDAWIGLKDRLDAAIKALEDDVLEHGS